MNIRTALERLTGRRARRPAPSASVIDKTTPWELRGFVRMTREATRTPIEFAPPGPKKTIIMHNDIDPTTGQVYPDYEARRAQRKAESQLDGWTGATAWLMGHNIDPEE